MTADAELQQVLNVLRRHLLPIASVALAGTVLAGFGGLLIAPRYVAQAEIVIEPQQPAPGSGQAVVLGSQDQALVQTQVAALSSRDHLRRVLESLEHDPAYLKAMVPPSQGRVGLSLKLRAWVKAQWLAFGAPVLNAALSFAGAAPAADANADPVGEPALDAMQRRLVVAQERGSQVVSVSYGSVSPERAALTANRLVQLFTQRQYDQKRENTNRALGWISGRIAELKQELERNDATIERYRIEHDLPANKQTDVVDARIAQLNHDLTSAQADMAARQSRLDYIADLGRRAPAGLIGNLDSPVLADLRHQEVSLRRTVADLTPSLGASHPEVRRAVAQLQETQRRIAQEVDRSATVLRDDVRMAAAREQSLQQQLAAVQAAAQKGQQAQVGLQEIERQTVASRSLYDNLSQRREQLREQLEMTSPDARILSLATPPDRTSTPNPVWLMLPAFVMCCIGGGVVAIGAERINRGLRSARDVQEVLGIRCVGLVPRVLAIGRKRPHEQILKRRFAAYTEAIRSIVAGMQLATPALSSKVVLITSSVPREGKTTLAVSFAVYAARIGRRVILVDLDFRHPAVMREVGGESLADGPADEADAEDFSLAAVRHVPSLGIDTLPLRSPPDDPITPFANGQLSRLMRALRAEYDLVVIDGPPLLAVTEAQLLTVLADQTLFAVRWGRTRQDVAMNALSLLRDPRLLGHEFVSQTVAAVVTQVDLRRHARYRFGDAAESVMNFRQYYVDAPRWGFRKLGFTPASPTPPVSVQDRSERT